MCEGWIPPGRSWRLESNWECCGGARGDRVWGIPKTRIYSGFTGDQDDDDGDGSGGGGGGDGDKGGSHGGLMMRIVKHLFRLVMKV